MIRCEASMKIRELILEAPLKDIHYHRTDDEGSFSEKDRKLLAHFSVIKRYHEELKKVPFDLYVYIIDSKGLEEIGREYPEQEITDRIANKMFRQILGHVLSDVTNAGFDTVFSEIKKNAEKNPKSVHFIMGDNYSDDRQIGPTSWILIHRLMHCWYGMDEGSFMERLSTIMKNLHIKNAGDIFTFKSVHGKLVDPTDLIAEIYTQYYLTGDVKVKIKNEKVEKLLADMKHFGDETAKKAKGKVYYI